MFEPFSHFLAYGATDQQTARELAGIYDGLLVPGTVAAFQREGTGGFVLTLSATQASPAYVIDPRFPLFQQVLPAAKKSHYALAEWLQDPELVREDEMPKATDFPSARTADLARRWVEINRDYASETSQKFEKYAERLGEEVRPQRVKGPSPTLALYVTANGPEDPWWEVSNRLFAQSQEHEEGCVRVVAAHKSEQLDALLATVNDPRIVLWVSGLEELMLPAEDLATYARAIRTASEQGQDTFALYGGFFHVLLSGFGLKGASHGIGYGEYREWTELPRSGPPPPRYYLRRVHRYVSQELAFQLYLSDRSLVECDCPECNGQPPVSLDYHALMKHSVHARAEEIRRWAQLDPATAADLLATEHETFSRAVGRVRLPPALRPQAERSFDHLPRWVEALRTA